MAQEARGLGLNERIVRRHFSGAHIRLIRRIEAPGGFFGDGDIEMSQRGRAYIELQGPPGRLYRAARVAGFDPRR